MAKTLLFRSRRDPVLVRLFRESGHSYEAGVAWLIDKLRDSFAQQPVPAALRRRDVPGGYIGPSGARGDACGR